MKSWFRDMSVSLALALLIVGLLLMTTFDSTFIYQRF